MLGNRSKYGSTLNAFDVWRDYMVSMGYGYPLGVDLPSEKRGFIPNSKFYSNVFKNDRWVAHNIISIAIGQGEILATPLQIANLGATIAKGLLLYAHVVRNERAPLEEKYTTDETGI